MALQPQATSTPVVGVASVSLTGTVTNEKTLTAALKEDDPLDQKKGVDVENLSNATSIS